MRASPPSALPALLLLALLLAHPSLAGEAVPAAISNRLPTLQEWAAHPVVLKAVRDQNAEKLAMEEIMRRDEAWRKSGSDDSFKKQLMHSDCAMALRSFAKNDRAVFEAFVMDNQGALVCTILETSDYWQGDEVKWQKSFVGEKGAVFVAQPELDESTKLTLVQTSVPILYKDKVMGVLMVGFNARLLRISGDRQK